METIEVRSKSYVIKWVNASENSTVHYELKPIKKSINFCIYTYKEGEEPNQNDHNILQHTKNGDTAEHHRRRSSTTNSTNSLNGLSLDQKLANAHLVKHHDLGRVNGDELRKGETHVAKATVLAFVFDNTFSKTTAKKVLFTQYSDKSPNENMPISKAPSSSLDMPAEIIPGTMTPSTVPYTGRRTSSSASSANSLKRQSTDHLASIKFELPSSDDTLRVKGGKYLQGFLLKKRRKKTGKNFNKRFFTLNFKYGILNYYLNDKSKHVRGNMFINYVGITADAKRRIIVLDSGLEIWTLKTLTDEDFKTWVNAFNAIKQNGKGPNEETLEYEQSIKARDDVDRDDSSVGTDYAEDLIRDLEILQHKFEGMRTRCLALNKSLEIQQPSSPHLLVSSDRALSTSSSTSVASSHISRKSSFWKKKKPTSPTKEPSASSPNLNVPRSPKLPEINTTFNNTTVHEAEVLKDELTEANNMILQLINQQKFRVHNSGSNMTRLSVGAASVATTAAPSIFSQEFFDANEYVNELNSGVLMINNNDSDVATDQEIGNNMAIESPITEEEEEIPDTDEEDDNGASSSEDDESLQTPVLQLLTPVNEKQTDFYPLSIITSSVPRRHDIPPSKAAPPSILSFVRKNIGKDLSTISMPVTSNEPLTVLQKYAEVLEYCTLLNDVMTRPLDDGERILQVAVFATSYLSSLRSKERNNRKPFNPLLGETYELVREDLGMRLISEKVSHRPPIFAMYADCERWSFQYLPSPAQKFWSKNAEVINKGVAKLTFKQTGEVYQWSQPITLLKNIIAGEKYTEPSSSLTVTSSTGQKAVVDFKQGGMFSGRSEELTMTAFDNKNKTLPLSVTGTWTEKMVLKRGKDLHELWHCGNLVHDSNKKYGFTEFAASLNEITPIERDKLAPTDSRLRPDMLQYEAGFIDEAETLKLKLEQDQRDRRTEGVPYEPLFFDKISEEKYEVKKGQMNYWERRRRGDWDGLLELW